MGSVDTAVGYRSCITCRFQVESGFPYPVNGAQQQRPQQQHLIASGDDDSSLIDDKKYEKAESTLQLTLSERHFKSQVNALNS